jgi:hypothetical protein
MDFETPAEDGTELVERQHEPFAAELAEVRVVVGSRDFLEPIQELQCGDDGELKRETEETACVLEFGTAGTIMQTEMANADKALGQDMREKAADKLAGGQGHLFLFALVAIVEILKGDGIVGKRNNPVVGNGNAKDVTTEILHQILDATQRRLDVDFPIFGKRLLHHLLDIESTVVGIQFACCPELSDGETKAIAELIGEQLDGEEELMRSGLPAVARAGGAEGAAGDDAMQMGMKLHGLPPGVQDHGEADLAAEILLPEFFQYLSRHFEEQVVEQLLIESDQGIEEVVNGEDDVIVGNGQDPELLGFEPLGFFEGATLRAMAILTGLVMAFPAFTDRANLQDATESGRAAIQNGTDGFGLLIRKVMSAFVFAYVLAENLSDTEFRPLIVVHDTLSESIPLIITRFVQRYALPAGGREERTPLCRNPLQATQTA